MKLALIFIFLAGATTPFAKAEILKELKLLMPSAELRKFPQKSVPYMKLREVSGPSKTTPVLFYDEKLAHKLSGTIRFAKDVKPQEIQTHFNSLKLIARLLDKELNIWTFFSENEQGIKKMLARAAKHPKAIYVLPEPVYVIPPDNDFIEIPGKVIVTFKELTAKKNLKEVESILKSFGAMISDSLFDGSMLIIRFDPKKKSNQEVIAGLIKTGKVKSASSDQLFKAKFK